MQQCDSNATRTSADIANEGRCLASSRKSQRSFDKKFGVRPRNQHVTSHFKIETKKLLVAGDVLQRLPLSAPLDIIMKLLKLFRVKRVFSVTQNERAVALEY